MSKYRIRTRTILSAVLIVVLMAVAGAFAASNTVPETGAGDGSNSISGYTVTNVAYTLSASDPYVINSVAFALNPTAGAGDATTVYAELNGNSKLCTGTAPNFTCDFSSFSVSASAAATFRVIAAQ